MKRKGSMKTQRLRKVWCPACGTITYMSRTAITRGVPLCGVADCACHGQAMICANPADAIECGLLTLDDLPRDQRTQVCRDNGWEDEIVRTCAAQCPGGVAYRIAPAAAIPF